MNKETIIIEEPAISQLLFLQTRAWRGFGCRFGSLSWLAVAGRWMAQVHRPKVDESWRGAVKLLAERPQDGAQPVISYDWYRSFIEFLVNSESHTWFSKIIIFGELTIAIALILGAFTGLAAFFGGLMNWSFIMAGSAPPMEYCSPLPHGLSWHGEMPAGLPRPLAAADVGHAMEARWII